MLIWRTFVSSAPLAQSLERGANKGKVMCSMLKESKSQRVKESKGQRVKGSKSQRVKESVFLALTLFYNMMQ